MFVQKVSNGNESFYDLSTSIVLSYDGRIAKIFFREANFEYIFGCKTNVSLALNDLFGINTTIESIALINSSMQSGTF